MHVWRATFSHCSHIGDEVCGIDFIRRRCSISHIPGLNVSEISRRQNDRKHRRKTADPADAMGCGEAKEVDLYLHAARVIGCYRCPCWKRPFIRPIAT